MIGDYTSGPTRKYHHTAPVAMIMSLHAALGALLDEGLEAAWARHAACGAALQDGLEKMGLELWAPEGPPAAAAHHGAASPRASTTPRCAARCCSATASRSAAASGPGPGRIWRIGCMGHTARLRNVTLLLAALAETLGR